MDDLHNKMLRFGQATIDYDAVYDAWKAGGFEDTKQEANVDRLSNNIDKLRGPLMTAVTNASVKMAKDALKNQ